MKWASLLHLYQPPHQQSDILEKVTRESYELIVSLLERYPKFTCSINISGSLVELLQHHGHEALLKKFQAFAKAGRIELLGSAMYHPILPLIPEAEVTRQIKLNQTLLSAVFGDAYQPRGCYVPEMAYSPAIIEPILEAGFEWIALDETQAAEGKPAPDVKYRIGDSALGVVFRNRTVSRAFPPEYVERHYEEIPYHLFTAHDGELFGHWHKEDHGFYEKAFTDPRITFSTVSAYRDSLTKEESIEVREMTWESTEEDLALGVLYPLWKDPRNPLHEALWHFTYEAMHAVDANQDDPGYVRARQHLDRGLASCMWWWASGRKPSPFSPVTWHPDEVEKGLHELLSSVTSLKTISPALRTEYTEEHARIIKTLREAHRARSQ